MKKRKPPYVLAGLLIAALGAAIVLNGGAFSNSARDAHEEVLEQPNESTPKTEPKGSILRRMQNKAIANSDGGAMPLIKRARVPKDGPVVKRPARTEEQKPKPRPDDVSSQWYDES